MSKKWGSLHGRQSCRGIRSPKLPAYTGGWRSFYKQAVEIEKKAVSGRPKLDYYFRISSGGDKYEALFDDITKNGEIYPPLPTPVPFVLPSGDFEMSWDTYDSTYNSMGGILTLTRKGDDYPMRLVYGDGSSGEYDVYTEIQDGTLLFTDNPGSAYGDFMYIWTDGELVFADNEGYIYSVPLLK